MNVRNLEGSQKLSLGREVLGRNKEDHESLNSYHLQSQCLSCGLEGQEAEEVPCMVERWYVVYDSEQEQEQE
jgi:hypothetical protein